MQVVNESSKLLTNFEVHSFLNDLKANRKKNIKSLSTVTHTALKYIDTVTCAPQQTASQITKFKKAVEIYNLTKAEVLQLINLVPRSEVEVQVIIEECDERLSEHQVEQLLTILRVCFPVEENVVASPNPGSASNLTPDGGQ